jgi:3-methyladenine DNA glycosylase AlkC
MGEPLKTFFSPELVRRLAADLVRVHPEFPKRAFVAQASEGLDTLELLDRGRHIARALAVALPRDYPRALDVLIRSLGPEHATDELIGAGMAPFFYYPHTLFVAEHGLGHFDLSMQAQVELTKRFSAEGSIRPYIAADPERSFAFLRSWAQSDNAHVRRLVSEGTRLRLPWAQRVAWLDEHPERIVELLEMLKDDPNTMVRRSVANNLNDLGKVHPDLTIRTCEEWLEGASAERRSLVEHALRSAVKRGEPRALGLLGYGERAAVRVDDVSFRPRRVAIGRAVKIAFTLTNTSAVEHALLVDLAVHFVKVRGTSRKVFKLERLVLAPHARAALSTTVSLAVHTTRKPRPGTHAVEAIVNGQPVALGTFEVVASAR